MKVAYVSATSPSSLNGAAKTARGWIDELCERGVEIDVVCRGEFDETVVEDGIAITRLAGDKPRAKIADRLRKGEYDVVLAQDLWSDIALEAAEETGIPSVLSMTTTHADEDVVSAFEPTRFVANSRYTQQWITSIWGRDPAVVYPHIDFEQYTAPEGPSNRVSMVTPIEMKGGTVFRAVAERSPEREFLAQGGWYSFRNDDYGWDPEMLRIQGSTFYDVPLDLPDEDLLAHGPTDVDVDDLENVTFEAEPGILETYAKTSVLLVPSIWPETFGRVVLEAMWNGIPVVASNQGGIPEACRGAGLLVDDFEDPDAWADALGKLDEPAIYEGFAARGRERAEAYRRALPDRIETLRTVLEEAAAEG